jgi:excisionase family DNA binding protein
MNVTKQRISWGLTEASVATGISVATLKRAVRAGKLRTSKVGRRTLVLNEDLQRFIRGDSGEESEAQGIGVGEREVSP